MDLPFASNTLLTGDGVALTLPLWNKLPELWHPYGAQLGDHVSFNDVEASKVWR